MPKPPQSDERSGRRDRRRRRRRHLYFVLDDWSMGYSIRKIGDPASSCRYAGLRPLPRPIYQLEAARGMAASFTACLVSSSRIMVAHPVHDEAQSFDARSRSLVYGPRPHGVPRRRPTFIHVGDDRLCALWGGSLHLLLLHHQPEQESASTSSSDPWSWRKLHDLPFDEGSVTAHAVHPDGRTVLVSVAQGSTFCFDVDAGDELDALNGAVELDWALPFHGRCHFVDELNAWVGLSVQSFGTMGHLCACPVVAPGSSSDRPPRPSWKTSKESLFSTNLAEKHAGATLVYMGSKSEFCLVECVNVGPSYICEGPLEPRRYDPLMQFKDKLSHPLLRLTTFSLVVHENGDLTTGDTRRFRYYSIPGSVIITRPCMHSPVVFWM